MNLWLTNRLSHGSSSSVDHFRVLYADLLQQIEVSDEYLSHREMETAEPPKRRIASSPRRSNHQTFESPTASDNNHNNSTTTGSSSSSSSSSSYLPTAFRVLSATRFADKEGGAIALRHDESVVALATATALEDSLVRVIYSMGQVLVGHAQQFQQRRPSQQQQQQQRGGSTRLSYTTLSVTRRDDEIFDYFCEKAILGLLVDIVLAKPSSNNNNNNNDNNNNNNNISSHQATAFQTGVVWSARVKAQVLQTVALLIASVKDASALYYMLSQNCINQLITAILPLPQWTEQALELMLPPYVDLLKHLSLQLGASPHLFPLFVVHENEKHGHVLPNETTTTTTTTSSSTTVAFPLFSATLQVLTSKFAQSDSFVHATCLNFIVNLMQITHRPVQDWVSHAATAQQDLANHVVNSMLVQRHHRMAQLTTGPVVDANRSDAIAACAGGLRDQLDALNDLLGCDIPSLSVRLCETVLRRFVQILLQDLCPSRLLLVVVSGTDDTGTSDSTTTTTTTTTTGRSMLMGVGTSDCDVIPQQEAAAQTAVFVLSQLFRHLEYDPLVRMLAVAVFHPRSSRQLWQQSTEINHADDDDDEYEYVYTKTLNHLVKGTCTDTVPNPFRGELIQSIQGLYGEWRVCSAVILIDSMVQAKALDLDILRTIEVIPQIDNNNNNNNKSVSAQEALALFLQDDHGPQSTACRMALDCSSSLAVHLIWLGCSLAGDDNNQQQQQQQDRLSSNMLQQALESAKNHFFDRVLDSQAAFGVSDIFVGLVEDVVQLCYKRHRVPNHPRSGRRDVYMFSLSQYDCLHYAGADVLVRRLRSAEGGDVENCRFNARMAIHFRAVCRIVNRLLDHDDVIDNKTKGACTRRISGSTAPPRFIDKAEKDLGQIFTCLQESIEMIDFFGRIVFPFTSTLCGPAKASSPNKMKRTDSPAIVRNRTVSSQDMLAASAQLTLVLDPTNMFVAKKAMGGETSSRGVVICCIPIVKVIAAACDGDTLHIAVHHDDVDDLIQNGNLTLRFASAGTSLVVQQYLERSRQVLREELLEKIKQLFSSPHE